MTGDDFREDLKWSVLAAVIVALFCGVIAVRKARAAIPGEPRATAAQEEGNPSADLRPVWVIVVYEVRNKKLIGITEFVFASRDECQENAAEARQNWGSA